MKPVLCRAVWCLCAVVCLAANGQEAGFGHIQVACAPGAQVHLDGVLEGVTRKDMAGLILPHVPAGPHTVKVAIAGFQAEQVRVDVRPGRVVVVRVQAHTPEVEIEQEGQVHGLVIAARVATLVVQSLPVECTIDIPTAGVRQASKTKDCWTARNLLAGKHEIALSAMGKTLRQQIELRPGQTLKLMADFLDGTLEVQAPEVRVQVQPLPAAQADAPVRQEDAIWLLDDFEAGEAVWTVQRWANQAEVTLVQLDGSRRLKVAYVPARNGKCVIQRLIPEQWAFETRDEVLLDLHVESEKPVQVAMAFFARKGQAYYEAKPLRLAPGFHPAVKFDLRADTFKSAETKWRHEARLDHADSVQAVLVLVMSKEAGSVTMDNVRFVMR